jgi:secreted PhoX family phosphatase
MKKQNRRSFLHFLGRAGLGLSASGFLVSLQSCNEAKTPPTDSPIPPLIPKKFPLQDIAHSLEDKLVLANGLEYDVLIRWDDPISNLDKFGFNNDYIAFVPFDANNPDDGMLWVNHEYFQELFVSGFTNEYSPKKTKKDVEKEMYCVGGSLVRIKKNDQYKWEVIHNDKHNRRLTGKTEIPFDWHEPIAGSTTAIGTFANCSGGITPWGTILTCEENYDMYYGETDYSNPDKPKRIYPSYYNWEKHFTHPPEHYGWVVEVNPLTGEAKKLVALGRCAHECATVHQTKDGRVVIYSGDDSNDECLYKFISNRPNDLRHGKLYVANTTKGEWVSVDYKDQEILRQNFQNQTQVLIRLREAAKLVGGTPLNRPEDIEIDPLTGHILIALTNNKPKGDYLGEILKIEELDNRDKTSLKFKSSTFLAGGLDTGFACPDNMAFDPKGNLWFTSDISGSAINTEPYTPFGNNGLFLVPSWGKNKGEVIQVASAPVDAEFTGPFFSPDGETLFLSVQHPGEGSTSMDSLTSHWPDGADNIPKPSVVCISGQALKDLMLHE